MGAAAPPQRGARHLWEIPAAPDGIVILVAALALWSLLVGAALAGFWGMLFAIPVAASIKILLVATLVPWLKRWAAEH